MILGLLAMAAANAAVLLGARTILDTVRSGKPALDLVLFLILRLFLISLAVLAFGVASCLTPLALGIAGAAALSVLLARGAHRGLRLPRDLPWGKVWSVVAALVAIRALVHVWMLAPYVEDTLAYHLPKVAEWTRAGAITRELGMDSRATFPAGFELVEIWWVLFLHHDVLIEIAGLEFLLLAAAGVYALAVELGCSPKASLAAALLMALGPGMYFQAVSCMNDGPVCALLIAATALLAARQPLLLAAVPIALGAGIKPTIVYALPGLGLLSLWMNRDGVPRAPATRPAAFVAVGALVAGASWYARNTVLFHNPLYPMGPGGMKSAGGATLQRLGPSLQALRENLACFLDIRIYDHSGAPDALCTGNFNWGAAAFALGVPALIVVLRSEPPLRRIAVSYAVSALCVFTLVELDLFYTRFVLFLTALPLLALARLWDRQRAVALLGGLALGLQAVATMLPGGIPAESAARLAATGWRERSAFAPPEDDVPGYCSEGSATTYALYGPSYSRRVVYLRDSTAEETLRHAEREGVTALYFSGAASPREVLVGQAALNAGYRAFQQGPWRGYSLRPPR